MTEKHAKRVELVGGPLDGTAVGLTLTRFLEVFVRADGALRVAVYERDATDSRVYRFVEIR